ncbi:MAG TPA: HGGxSTG domain-containing protein [Burkholderiaceae bacterium]|nr:HGGxSTG domain-containing protein [Burkholderiaceae bacterium]
MPTEVRLSRLRAETQRCREQLSAADVDPDSELGHKLMAKLQATGGTLCLAQTREGHPCRMLGDGKGGRCKFHGGKSTGPRTVEGLIRSASNQANWHRNRLGMPLVGVPGVDTGGGESRQK